LVWGLEFDLKSYLGASAMLASLVSAFWLIQVAFESANPIPVGFAASIVLAVGYSASGLCE